MEFKVIQNTPLHAAFSDLGKRIFMPEGIFYWAGRAKKEADINGTIGSAFGFEKDFIDGGSSEWVPCYVKEIKEFFTLPMRSVVPYAAVNGLPETREAWKNWIARKSGLSEETRLNRIKKHITLPMVTSGVTNGIFSSCMLLLNPGEFIIAPNKRWENYDTIIKKFMGAKIKNFEFFKEYKINIEGLKQAIEEVAKVQEKIVIILNFPNNPTGYVPTLEEAKKIVSLLKQTQTALKKPIMVIVDDAYEPYVYGTGHLTRSLFYDLLEAEEDVIPIKLDGITKELLIYGGRIGFLTIGLKPKWVKNDAELELLKKEIDNKLEAINRSTISNCNHYFQAVTQEMLSEKNISRLEKSRDRVKALLEERCNTLNNELSKLNNPNATVDPNSGGFFLFLNLNPKIKASEFAKLLIEKYKVGIIPAENPKQNINGIRIAYCSIDITTIPELVKRIEQALAEFKD